MRKLLILIVLILAVEVALPLCGMTAELATTQSCMEHCWIVCNLIE